MTFPREAIEAWNATAEVRIETSRGGGGPVHRTIIWIVVLDGETPYVRSVRGPAGRWYRELRANPQGAVIVGDTRVPVATREVTDAATIARVSEAIRDKYQSRWPGPTASMLREHTLPTTLRLEPIETGS
jgi:hypothetical protein